MLALTAEQERTKRALDVATAQCQGLSKDLTDARSQVLELQEKLSKEGENGRAVRVELDAARERLQRLQNQLEEATRDRNACTLKLVDSEQTCESMARELGELRASLSRLKHQAQELSTLNSQQAHTATQQRAEATQELERTRTNAAQRWQALDADYQGKSKQIAELEPALQEERAARALLQDKMEESASKVTQLQALVESVQGRLEVERARAETAEVICEILCTLLNGFLQKLLVRVVLPVLWRW